MKVSLSNADPSSVPFIARRMACWGYEGMLMFGVVFLAGYLFGTLSQTRNGMDNRHALQGFLFVVFGIYFVWFWANGQTLAMKTWNIRIVDRQGQKITQKRALLRYTLSWLWLLPPLALSWAFGLSGQYSGGVTFVWIAAWAASARLQSNRQFWHDVLAGTQLVSYKGPDSPKLLAKLAKLRSKS